MELRTLVCVAGLQIRATYDSGIIRLYSKRVDTHATCLSAEACEMLNGARLRASESPPVSSAAQRRCDGTFHSDPNALFLLTSGRQRVLSPRGPVVSNWTRASAVSCVFIQCNCPQSHNSCNCI